MKILILNWRDIKNPKSGGAEILTHEIAKGLNEKGHKITQISSGFSGCKTREIVDGVKFIRIGQWWSVHLLSVFYYFFKLRNDTDIIIDEVHWFPFFAKLFAPKKTILLACEVATKLFFKMFPYPFAIAGRTIEKIYLYIYRNAPVLVISPSTKEAFIKEGFKAENITILPMGLSVPSNINIYPKERKQTLIYLGRLSKQKGIDDALEMFAQVKKEIPEIILWIVGSGEKKYTDKIMKKAKTISSSDIIFFGFVSERIKFKLLSKAHLLVVPSMHEGWGLIVHEAGIVGTPAIVYNVPGLRDNVEDGVNGFRVNENPLQMAKVIVEIFRNPVKYDFMCKMAMEISGKYNWDKTTEVMVETLNKL